MRARSLRRLAAVLATAASTAFAGGPLGLCGNAAVRYTTPIAAAPVVTLNYDGGGSTLGARTKAQADTIVNNAIAMWTNVPTASITLQRGADLPVDVTSANFSNYLATNASFSDGISPVVYDTDGSIIDAMLGVGARNSVLGFAGSAWTCTGSRYTEGRAVINGFIGVGDAVMTNVLAHEIGHLIGLDHTQLDSTQGLASSNYPLMYPIAYRTLQSVGDDDISAVSALYPQTNVGASFGTLTGTFRLADGATPVRGANIWVKETTSGKVYSVVSDYLMQNNGAFQMLLPPGTYTLRAEAIDSQFTGGSSVGPYSDNYPSTATSPAASFDPPLYVGGVAMAAITLGNATPTTFSITAGCTATASFRIDGTGSVTGNCGASSPPPTTAPRLVNISTRGQVGTGNNVMIAGFVIGGSTPKTVVIRARGPSMAALGVPGTLTDPVLQLFNGQTQIAVNDNWSQAANAGTVQGSGYAPSDARESAIYTTLNPGAYTAIVTGAGGSTGVALVEVFEFDHPEVPVINIATRGQVLTASDVMIAGFIIQGNGPQTVAIRARGPSLAANGITNFLANPALQLVRSSDNATLATNDNWGTAANAAQLAASGFAPANSLEAAVLITLNPGAYSAIVTGAGGATGVGLVEVFAVN